jgi:tetratricopeptide (TPR) repeat protein
MRSDEERREQQVEGTMGLAERKRPLRRRLAVALTLLAAVTTTHSAWADSRTEARRYFKEGMALIGKKKYDDGIRALLKANELMPHPNVLFNIARAQASAGQLDDAIATYKQYLATDPPDRAEVVLVMRQLEDQASKEKAEAAAVETGRKHFQTGMALVAQGKYDDGVRELEAANAIRPHPNVIGKARTEDIYQETVVTASRGAQSPLEAPNSTTIITAGHPSSPASRASRSCSAASRAWT